MPHHTSLKVCREVWLAASLALQSLPHDKHTDVRKARLRPGPWVAHRAFVLGSKTAKACAIAAALAPVLGRQEGLRDGQGVSECQ